MKFLLIVLSISVITAAPLSVHAEPVRASRVEPLTELELLRFTGCARDKDCLKVYNGCCQCSGVGSFIAINGHRLESFKEMFSCLGVSCRKEDEEAQCGEGLVSCIEQRCKLFLTENIKKPLKSSALRVKGEGKGVAK